MFLDHQTSQARRNTDYVITRSSSLCFEGPFDDKRMRVRVRVDLLGVSISADCQLGEVVLTTFLVTISKWRDKGA